MYKNIFFIFLLTIGSLVWSQEKSETLKVKGNCGMCKERIENAVKEIPSAYGTWNAENETLIVSFDASKTSLDAIAKKIAEVGHDNALYSAESSVYESLPACCLYDKMEAENSSFRTEKIKVRGNCGSCKKRIEAAVAGFPSATGNWDIVTKVLTLNYDPTMVSKGTIMKKIAEAGHDNELFTADNSVYEKLPGCCLYDRKVDWDNVENSAGTHVTESGSHTGYDNHNDHTHEDVSDNAVDLTGVTVVGNRASHAFDKNSVGLVENITDKELLKAACCNLSESFETNATVDVSYANAVTGTKQLKMLGLDQKYTLLTKEILPEIRGISTAYGLQFIPGRWIQSIQLVKGGGSVTNGYEAIAGHINTELYKSHDKHKTSLNIFADINTRFEANVVHNDNINEHWTQSFLLHGNATVNRMDSNDDNFMDQPIGRNVNLSYLLNFNDLGHSGFATHFGVNLVNDHRLGGEMNFQEKTDKLTTNAYGLGIDIQQFQVWNKTGYIFPGRPYQSVGFMNQFTYHEQDSYFGLKSYEAEQRTYYSNLIFESIFGHTGHKYKAGLSFLYDVYDELYLDSQFKRSETVPGAFFEYTFTGTKLTAVAGARLDFHNLAGTQFTPRLNLKYDITPKTIIRASVGRGFRTANVFAESQSYFASNRRIEILSNVGEIYGLEPEIAWNYGISLHQEFKLFNRKSTIVADFFRTDFTDQVVLDLDNSPQTILFYNLDGKSYANSLQVQWDFQPVRRLDARLAYKFYDTQTEYLSGEKELPFTAQHRGFFNLAYSTIRKVNGKQWSFDATLQWVGEQRLPDTSTNPVEFQLGDDSNSYFLLNAQISHNFNKSIRLYLGGENLLSYTQDNPILDAQNPFGNYFDGGMVYAPVMPANFYIGLDIDF